VKLPDRIYLQNIEDDDEYPYHWNGVTLFEEFREEDDIAYVRQDVAATLWEHCQFLLGVVASQMSGAALYDEICEMVDKTAWLIETGKGVEMSQSLTIAGDVRAVCYLGAEVQHIEVLIFDDQGYFKTLSELLMEAFGDERLNDIGAQSLGHMKITFERG